MLLARHGYKVLLVDRATFPSEIPHGHFIHRQGPQRLARWALLDRIASTNCPAVTTMVTHFGDFPLVGRELAQDGIALGYGPDGRHSTQCSSRPRPKQVSRCERDSLLTGSPPTPIV
jgi:2-polyprenyl-6-methoxyphenol hydroxylase-like FAD-dependent oxidoreductase